MAKIKRATAIKNNDGRKNPKTKKEEVETFFDLLKSDWSIKVSSTAFTTLGNSKISYKILDKQNKLGQQQNKKAVIVYTTHS